MLRRKHVDWGRNYVIDLVGSGTTAVIKASTENMEVSFLTKTYPPATRLSENWNYLWFKASPGKEQAKQRVEKSVKEGGK